MEGFLVGCCMYVCALKLNLEMNCLMALIHELIDGFTSYSALCCVQHVDKTSGCVYCVPVLTRHPVL